MLIYNTYIFSVVVKNQKRKKIFYKQKYVVFLVPISKLSVLVVRECMSSYLASAVSAGITKAYSIDITVLMAGVTFNFLR